MKRFYTVAVLFCTLLWSNANAQYCYPNYMDPCTSEDYIDDVIFNTLSNLNTGCSNPGPSNYADYTGMFTTVATGSSYTISAKSGSAWQQYIVAYVDWNQDDDYDDAGEFYDLGFSNPGGTVVSASIDVPAGALTGTTRLRLMCRYGSTPLTQIDVCNGGLEYGEVEEYSLTVISGCVMLTTTGSSLTCTTDISGTASVTGAASTASYIWSNGSTTSALSGLSSGIYDVTVQDGSCFGYGSANVAAANPLTASIMQTNITCNGLTDGVLIAQPAGGPSTAYSYAWTSGVTSQGASGLSAGPHTVTITSGTCILLANRTITEPSVLSVSVSSTSNVTCPGWNNGSIDITPSGGTMAMPMGYNYAWSNGSNNEDLSFINGGSYSVTVSDANNCTAITSASITEPPMFNVTTTKTDETCLGNDGTATVIATGGNGSPYSYQWSNGDNTATATNLIEGWYWVDVYDQNGCQTGSNASIYREELILGLNTINASCGTSNGSASASATGGLSPYSYAWSTGTTGQAVSGLAAGVHFITVMDTQGCIQDNGFAIVNTGAPNITLTSTPIACRDDNNGTMSVAAVGGTTPYSYQWMNYDLGVLVGTTQTITGLAEGLYLVTVSDAQVPTCITIAGNNITNPPAFFSDANGNDVSTNGGSDGSASAWSWDGVWPHSYVWSTGSTTSFISGLTAGTYTATITDDNGCAHIEVVTVNEPPPCTMTVTINSQNDNCNNWEGWATAVGTNGNGPFSYNWQWASGSSNSQTISNIGPDTYDVTITDKYNCQASGSVTITAPFISVSVNVSVTNPACGASDGSAVSTAFGGTMPYSYLWDGGATTSTITGLNAGTYDITVLDVNLCPAINSAQLSNPGAPMVSTSYTDVSCNGAADGTISAIVSGGTTPYFYAWSTGATTPSVGGLSGGIFNLTVTDSQIPGCANVGNVWINENSAVQPGLSAQDVSFPGNTDGYVESNPWDGNGMPYSYQWSTGTTTQMVMNLGIGWYHATVTDNIGCFSTDSIEIDQPFDCDITVTTVQVNDNCGFQDGSLSMSAAGGTPPYWQNWSNGDWSNQINGLASGSIYAVTVFDMNGCQQADGPFTITGPTAPLSVSVTTTPATCGASDGSANSIVAGGTTPYTYLWNSGATTTSQTGLAAGAALVTIADSNGCMEIDGAAVNNPGAPSVTVTTTNLNCVGDVNGTATVDAVGGLTPYTYAWSDINGNPVGNTQTLTGLAEGVYIATVTDSQVPGCSAVDGDGVNAPPAIEIDIMWTWQTSCANTQDGQASIGYSSGTAPMSYLWENGSTNDNHWMLSGGSNLVTLTDGNGCSKVFDVTITTPPAILITTTATPANCGTPNGLAHADATGGTGGLNYSWDTGDWGQDAYNLFAGNYLVTVSDGWGCQESAMATVNNTNAPTITITNGTVMCAGDSDGTSSVAASGGLTPYTYMWANGNTTNAVSGLPGGLIGITVSDAASCNAIGLASVVEPSLLSASISTMNTTYIGNSDGSASVMAMGGTSPYSYLWSNTAVTPTITGLAPSTLSATVTDTNGCIATDSGTVTDPPCTLTIGFNKNNVQCNGASDGNAFVVPIGGIAPFSYLWDNGNTSDDNLMVIAGFHTVTVTDAVGCTQSGGINVNQPSAIISSVVATNSSCNGIDNAVLAGSASGGNPVYNYLWSDGQTTATAVGLSPGTYGVTLTDQTGCININSGSVTEPTALVTNMSSTNSTCGGNDGSATVAVSGGAGGYSYLWFDSQITATAVGLPAVLADVTVTDANGCEMVDGIMIIDEPAPAVIMTINNNVSCNGGNDGSATGAVMSGTSPYTYVWSTGETTTTAITLAAGPQFVQVTDGNGCITVAPITLTEPGLLTYSATVTDALCNGSADGAIDIIVLGGVGPYNYSWTNGNTNPNVTGLTAGGYTGTVTDMNGCILVATETVTEPSIISVTMTAMATTCDAGSDGTAGATIAGGTSGYTFMWSNGNTTQNLTGLSAGTYDVTVVDANMCTANGMTNVTQPTPVTVLTTTNDATCLVANGDATAVASGGTSGYTYLWEDAQALPTATGLAAGAYNVTATDAAGCTGSTTAAVGNIGAPTVSITGVMDVYCTGGNNGAATATATGGVTPYVYAWSNAQTTNSASGLTAGMYTISVVDANFCLTQVGVNINEPTLLMLSTTATDIACNGDASGMIELEAVGGVSPYTYMWDDGQSTQDATGLSGGTLGATVTDANGCVAMKADNVFEPALLTSTVTNTDILCKGDGNGMLTLAHLGGTSPFMYAWSNGASTQSLVALNGGDEDVTITDANGCMEVNSGFVNEPVAMSSFNSSMNVSCNGGSDATATYTMNGGTAPYTYTWTSGGTNATESGLAAGIHCVTVTDANACNYLAPCVNIMEPSALTASINQLNATCNGDANGQLEAVPMGGIPAYNFLWSTGETTAMIGGLAAGTATVSVFDANGCMNAYNATITEPSTLTSTISMTDASCNGSCDGTAASIGMGGTSPYTYAWNTGDIGWMVSSLCAGSYDVSIMDANGCMTTNGGNVTELSAVSVTGSQTDANCGSSDGSASVIATGGATGYSYTWSNGGTTAVTTGLNAGAYQYTVTDGVGCMAFGNVLVGNASGPAVTISGTTANLCNGDANATATVMATGGSTPYTYLWDDAGAQTTATAVGLVAGTYNVVVQDASGCVGVGSATILDPLALDMDWTSADISCNGNSDGAVDINILYSASSTFTYTWSNGATIEDISGLAAGSYDVTVTDGNGCMAWGIGTILEPAVIVSTVTGYDATCFALNNAWADLEVTGGTMPYSYNWSNGDMNEDLIGAMAGAYDVTITDANGCGTMNSITLSEPSNIVISGTVTDAACGTGDGQIVLSVTGGMTGYTYSWLNGQSTAAAIGLFAGAHVVDVTDANGCTVGAAFTVNNLNAPTVSTTSNDVTCYMDMDGSATATVSGGTAPYTYMWNDAMMQLTSTASGLDIGSYDVVVTDAGGCAGFASVIITEPDLLAIILSADDESCNSACDGAITSVVTGGTPGYTYDWSNGATSSGISGLCIGAFDITVTDANGCIVLDNATISGPSAVTLTTSATAESCADACDGSAVAIASGGATTSYTYLWSEGTMTASIAGMCQGSYTVTATDGNGCESSSSVNIIGNDSLEVVVSAVDANCLAADGIVSSAVTGGTTGYAYAWSNSATTDNQTGLSSGSYAVTVTDANGCEASGSAAVGSVGSITASAITDADVICAGESTGQATANGTGGTAPYAYLWDNSTADATATGLAGGTYSVTVSDANGCFDVAQANIDDNNPALNVSLTYSDDTPTVGQALADVTGGTAPYTYDWNDGNGTTFVDTAAVNINNGDDMSITVTDVNGCTVTDNMLMVWSGVDELGNASQVSLYPNPVSSDFSVTFTGKQHVTGVKILNILGETLLSESANVTNGSILNFGTEGMPNGVYFFIVENENQDTTSLRFVKNK